MLVGARVAGRQRRLRASQRARAHRLDLRGRRRTQPGRRRIRSAGGPWAAGSDCCSVACSSRPSPGAGLLRQRAHRRTCRRPRTTLHPMAQSLALPGAATATSAIGLTWPRSWDGPVTATVRTALKEAWPKW